MAVALTVPKAGPTELVETWAAPRPWPSTIAGMAIDSGQATGSFANDTADIKELVLTGPDMKRERRRHVCARRLGRIEVRLRRRSDESRAAREALQPAARGFGAHRWRSNWAGGEPDDGGQARREPAAVRHECRRAHGEQHVHGAAAGLRHRAGAAFRQRRSQPSSRLLARNLPRVTAKTVYEKNQLRVRRDGRGRAPLARARRKRGLPSRPRRAASARAESHRRQDAVGVARRGRKRPHGTRTIRSLSRISFCSAVRNA